MDSIDRIEQLVHKFKGMTPRTPDGSPVDGPRVDLTGIDDPFFVPGPGNLNPNPNANYSNENYPGGQQNVNTSTDPVPLEVGPVSGPVPDPNQDRFKEEIRELAQIEDALTEYKKKVSELSKRRTELRKRTMQFMVQNQVDVAQMKENDKYSLVQYKRTVNPLTKASLPRRLREFLVEEQQMSYSDAETTAKRIVEWIYARAEKKTSVSLRRTKPKNFAKKT